MVKLVADRQPKIRFLRETKKGWEYIPPSDAIKAGVLRCCRWSDGRTARKYAREYNKDLDLWRKGKLPGVSLTDNSTLSQVVVHYMNTSHYLNLSNATRKSYKHMFAVVVDSFNDMRIKNIRVSTCQSVYDSWVAKGPQYAKSMVRGISIIYSHAMAHEIAVRNPMASVKKVTHHAVTKVWTKDQVDTFIETAFTQWKYRNIGILVVLAYEYAQRPMDIATLRWSDVDFDRGVITITQTKRGATVQLPLDDEVRRILEEQHEVFGVQEYVLPHMRPSDGAYRPMGGHMVASIAKEVLALAKLPDDLYIGKLRNTAINEMVEAGVDSAAMMSVTGHQNIGSLNPYLKHTLSSATQALDKRRSR